MITTTAASMPRIVLVLRPFGYLLVTAVYATVLAAVLVLGWGGLFLGIDSGFGDGAGVADIGVDLLVAALIGPILGGALGIATSLTASLTMLGGLAFVRSLTPSYADLPLTHSIRSRNAVGPPRLTPGVMSLLPTRRGRFAEFALSWNLGAQSAQWRVLGACAWLGIADMVTAGWVKWPATGGWVVVWSVISLILVALGVVGLVRAVASPGRPGPGRPPRRRAGAGRLP